MEPFQVPLNDRLWEVRHGDWSTRHCTPDNLWILGTRCIADCRASDGTRAYCFLFAFRWFFMRTSTIFRKCCKRAHSGGGEGGLTLRTYEDTHEAVGR